METVQRPLHELAPGLAQHLPAQALCDLPTPVSDLPLPGLGCIIVKRDDLTAADYGGNKLRKLEFLLADAQAKGASELLTFGFAGSNFAAATALQAQRHDMRCISLLLPQSPEPYVRDNLRLQLAAGAELHLRKSVPALAADALWQMLRHRWHAGAWPYWIPAGGSSPLGVLGFVNAALELDRQTDAFPTDIYVAMGSMGSVAGLAVGAAILGVDTRIVAVRVVEPRFANPRALRKLIVSVLALLRKQGVQVPSVDAVLTRIEIREEFFGEGYGVPSNETRAAMDELRTAGLPVESAYTGKAFACILADRKAGRSGPTPLFWLTCNGTDTRALSAGVSASQAPEAFRDYFKA